MQLRHLKCRPVIVLLHESHEVVHPRLNAYLARKKFISRLILEAELAKCLSHTLKVTCNACSW